MTEPEGRSLTAPCPDAVPGGAEAERLLLAAADHAALDRIAALAARLVGAPSAQVSLVTDVQTVAGGVGVSAAAVGSCGPLSESLCEVTAGSGATLIVHDAPRDHRVSARQPVTAGIVGSYLGVPLKGDSGRPVGAFCVYGPEPRRWSPADVQMLEQLSDFVRAELEVAALARDLEETRTRAELASEASGVGWFDWDLVTGVGMWDDRLATLLGYDPGEPASAEAFAARLHPDDAAWLDAAVQLAVSTVGPLHVVHRVVLPEGRVRWLESRGRALAGADGTATHLLGVCLDVTDQHDSEARAERVLASMTVGYLSLDAEWRITYVNAEGARLIGVPTGQMVGEVLWHMFPGNLDSVFERTYRRVAETGRSETIEAFYPEPLNAWYEIRAVREADGLALYFLDITERRRALELLQISLDVSEQMAGLGLDDAVAALARRVVPGLADWAIVSLLEADGTMRDVACWHADPALLPTVQRYAAHRLEAGGSGTVDNTMRTGVAAVLRSGVVDFLERTLPSAAAREALLELAPHSGAAVPMVARPNVTGVLSLYRGPERPAMDARELAVAESVCRRAGLAIDNARLSAVQARDADRARTVAQALQQALLTRLPQPAGLRLAALYQTAEDGDQVGGDWYDAVASDDGGLVVIIGDVVGHDIRAAASMGQLRTMLRMLALQHTSPAAMLTALDEATERLGVDTLATVLVARIDPPGEARADGTADRLVRWSSAGHPSPVAVHADGSATVLAADEIDLMVGVQVGATRSDHSLRVPATSTLLLYTDGLVERRGEDIDRGVARLTDAVRRRPGLEPGALLDHVLAECVEAGPNDDVALLAVRLGG